jgi:hypothetical protein
MKKVMEILRNKTSNDSYEIASSLDSARNGVQESENSFQIIVMALGSYSVRAST